MHLQHLGHLIRYCEHSRASNQQDQQDNLAQLIHIARESDPLGTWERGGWFQVYNNQ